jgi:competence protein ComEA
MKTIQRPEAVRSPRGLRDVVGLAKAGLIGALAAARAWRWGAVFGRVALAGLGLVLLGAIGRSAFARNMLTTDAPPVSDAGLATPSSASATPTAGSGTASAPAIGTLAMASPATPQEAPAPASPPTAPSTPQGRATPDDPVYLNQATFADLRRLPGVGPKRADAILSLRTKLGHFHQIEDLMKVKGIGRSSMRKLRPLVRLDPPPAASVVTATAPTTPPP